jgi:hypothetical protein
MLLSARILTPIDHMLSKSPLFAASYLHLAHRN